MVSCVRAEDRDLDFPLHSPDFYRRRPVPGLQGTARNLAGVLERRHQVLGAAEVRGHPVRVDAIRTCSPRPRASRSPTRCMPNPVQEGNLIFTDPPRHRQLRKLDQLRRSPGGRWRSLEPKVREIVYGVLAGVESGSTHEFAEETRRAPAHPDDRRATRRSTRRLGEIPQVVGCMHRATPIPRSSSTRSWPSASCSSTSAADRRASRRSRGRHAVGPCPRGGRRRAADGRGPPELRIPAAGGRQRDHPEPDRARHARAHRASGRMQRSSSRIPRSSRARSRRCCAGPAR